MFKKGAAQVVFLTLKFQALKPWIENFKISNSQRLREIGRLICMPIVMTLMTCDLIPERYAQANFLLVLA